MFLYSKFKNQFPSIVGIRSASDRRPYFLPNFTKKFRGISAKIPHIALQSPVPIQKFFRNEFNSYKYHFIQTPVKYELLENYRPHLFDHSKRLFTENYIRVRAIRPDIVFANIHEVQKFHAQKKKIQKEEKYSNQSAASMLLTTEKLGLVEEDYTKNSELLVCGNIADEDETYADTLKLRPTEFYFEYRNENYDDSPDDLHASQYDFSSNKYGNQEYMYHTTSAGYDYYNNLQDRRGHGYSKYPDEDDNY